MAEDFYREDGFATPTEDLQHNFGVLLASDAAHVVVIEEEGGPVGFAVTTTSLGLESGLIAELEDLYVEPPSRRRGHAERLIDDAAAWARQTGCSHIEVVTAPNGRDISHLHATTTGAASPTTDANSAPGPFGDWPQAGYVRVPPHDAAVGNGGVLPALVVAAVGSGLCHPCFGVRRCSGSPVRTNGCHR